MLKYLKFKKRDCKFYDLIVLSLKVKVIQISYLSMIWIYKNFNSYFTHFHIENNNSVKLVQVYKKRIKSEQNLV